MAQTNPIDSNTFWLSGFVVQTHDDQFYLAEGPFQDVSLHKNEYTDYIAVNDLLIKPNYWNFLDTNVVLIAGLKPKTGHWLNRKDFHDFIFDSSKKTTDTTVQSKSTILSHLEWDNRFKADFELQFNHMQELISKQHLEKAVPIGVVKTETANLMSPQKLIQNLLLGVNTKSWIYGFWDHGVGWVGQTPELLFQTNTAGLQNKIKTMALAGTWPKTPGIVNDYQDPKIWNEHRIVVKDIKHQLAKMDCSLHSETEVIELKTLAHLKTNLEFKLENPNQIFEVLQSLHPTAALGIYPRNEQISKTIQSWPVQKQRGSFGAPFGVLSKNISHLVVGIRNICWNQNHVQLFAGCGITKDSVLASEYNEVLYKMESVKKMLGLVPL